MFLLLQEGIVIIDTPGIGTSKEMTERIQQYLANAFGCIYVINSASAGGVQKGRVRYTTSLYLYAYIHSVYTVNFFHIHTIIITA